jgi:hypothetical protein
VRGRFEAKEEAREWERYGSTDEYEYEYDYEYEIEMVVSEMLTAAKRHLAFSYS